MENIARYLVQPIRNLVQLLHSHTVLYWMRQYRAQAISVSSQPALIVSPHQDDETLGCGGLIALKRQMGSRVAIVFLTDGGASPTLDPECQDIVELRRREATSALRALEVPDSDIYFLNYPDGQLPELSESQQRSLVLQLSDLMQQYQVQEVYVPHAKDGHCDHEAAFQIVQSAIAQLPQPVQLFQYPIWLFWKRALFLKLKPADLTHAYRLDISSVKAKKHAAIQTYQSQLPFLPFGFLNLYLSSTEIFLSVAEREAEQT